MYRRSRSSSTAALAGPSIAPARAARSAQPTLASVGAAAAGLDPASLATLRSVSRRAGRGLPASRAIRAREPGIPVALRSGRLDQQRLRQALRQQHADLAAPVPDHHLGGPLPQRRDVPRFMIRPGAAGAMRRTELRRGPQQPGRDQAHHLVQVLQPVLHRRRGQQQQMAGPQLADQLPRGAARCAHPVRLVHDDQVPLVPGQRGLERLAARGGQRGDHDRPVGAPGYRSQSGNPAPGRSHGRHAELALELLLPLVHQPGRGDHQGAVGQPAQPQLGQDQAGLDGLAQPDLVGQDRPAPHPPQHTASRLQLVVERAEPERRHGKERVEPRPAPYPHGLVHQQ